MDQQSRWTESPAGASQANGQAESGHRYDDSAAGTAKADLSKRFIAAVIDCVVGASSSA